MLERSALHSRRKEFHESKFKNTKEKSANRWPVFDAGLMDAGRPSSHSSARRVARTLSAPSRARAARRAHDLGVGDRVAVDAEGFAHLGQLEQVHAREQLRVGDHLWVDDGRQVEVAVVREDGDLRVDGGEHDIDALDAAATDETVGVGARHIGQAERVLRDEVEHLFLTHLVGHERQERGSHKIGADCHHGPIDLREELVRLVQPLDRRRLVQGHVSHDGDERIVQLQVSPHAQENNGTRPWHGVRSVS
mmetsp:Transcript_21616/g.55373  ORF Transcript_21616/g.55373 Transcript_21616/m.55373 type:complete len:250 (-) Transcript_21616:105-854(-)